MVANTAWVCSFGRVKSVATTQPFVVDASVGFSWVYLDQASAYTDGVLATMDDGATAVVPTLWPIEIAMRFWWRSAAGE
jgi:hypothetical protein